MTEPKFGRWIGSPNKSARHMVRGQLRQNFAVGALLCLGGEEHCDLGGEPLAFRPLAKVDDMRCRTFARILPLKGHIAPRKDLQTR